MTQSLPAKPFSDAVAVVRSGPRGWHWIDKATFDPKVHKPYESPAEKPVKKES